MKKIIAILSILLILSAFVIPCFADAPDYQYYVSTPMSVTKNWTSGWSSLNSGTITYGTSLNYNYIANSSPYSYGFYTNTKTVLNHTYLVCVIYSCDLSYLLMTPNLYGTVVEFSSGADVKKSFIKSSYSGNNFSVGFYSGATNNNINIDISYYCLFDLTEMYGSDIPTKEVVLQDLSVHGIDPFDVDGDITGYYHIPDAFQPLGNFYRDLFHSWDYLPDLWTKHSALLALLAAAVGGIGITAVIILIIKRFKK